VVVLIAGEGVNGHGGGSPARATSRDLC
jgi:hypothetical protein